ncbi:type II restriction enzyme [Abditibacterium utsteinense]|uniref:Type II restriction enzyme n=1 Tax=Abditibacterium utsteinense TaxID=1960156 RepID=A0A2S8SVH6_9BACT|nr:type II restriction endonuclease [Abditibacterium utsteinense]PQV64790.1 type II restriction enzyme [Abditibacterium utsteinense]
MQLFNAEFHLLSSLCDAPNIEGAARQLLRDYPKVVRAFPLLLAWRRQMTLLVDAETARVEVFDFAPKDVLSEIEIERYVRFLGESGLLDLLANIKSVPDYATGVEVGIDTNGRKGRSGNLAVKALTPHIERALENLGDVDFWPERTYAWMRAQGCPLTLDMAGWKWDGAFHSQTTGRWVVMEINHYGTTGSKPAAIANDYIARERELLLLGVGFLWVTDGLAWKAMQPVLKRAFQEIRFVSTIQLARDGLLEHALRSMLGPK